jgi:transcriptional regulator with XRE-family HTH domain
MNKIKDFIAQRELSQVQMARDLGYSEEYLSRVINGKSNMTDAFRWRFLEVYGITAMGALNGDDHAND